MALSARRCRIQLSELQDTGTARQRLTSFTWKLIQAAFVNQDSMFSAGTVVFDGLEAP